MEQIIKLIKSVVDIPTLASDHFAFHNFELREQILIRESIIALLNKEDEFDRNEIAKFQYEIGMIRYFLLKRIHVTTNKPHYWIAPSSLC